MSIQSAYRYLTRPLVETGPCRPALIRHKALRQMRYAKYTLPLLLRKERKLRKKGKQWNGGKGEWVKGNTRASADAKMY